MLVLSCGPARAAWDAVTFGWRGGDGLMVGLDDLRGLFQPQCLFQ